MYILITPRLEETTIKITTNYTVCSRTSSLLSYVITSFVQNIVLTCHQRDCAIHSIDSTDVVDSSIHQYLGIGNLESDQTEKIYLEVLELASRNIGSTFPGRSRNFLTADQYYKLDHGKDSKNLHETDTSDHPHCILLTISCC